MESLKEEYRISKITVGNMYCIVYHGLTEKFNLSPTETLLIATIISLSHKKGYCFSSERSIASILGVSSVTVSTNLTDLKSRGLIVDGKRDEKYKTIHRKIGPEVEDYLNYLKVRIEKSKSKDKDSLNNN